jgi:uncharacterized protein (DUF305 family)
MKTFITITLGCLFAVGYAANAQVSNTGHTAQYDKKAGHHERMMVTGNTQKDMQMMNEMMMKHLGKSDGEYDLRFIDLMIPHHEGAVMMASDALKNATHQELKDMAAKMIKDQQKEIEQLKKWRQNWYGHTAAAKETGQ